MGKTFNVLVSTILNSQIFFAEKNVRSFCKSTHIFFQQKISVYAIFNDQSLNDTSTNDIIRFNNCVLAISSNLPVSVWAWVWTWVHAIKLGLEVLVYLSSVHT